MSITHDNTSSIAMSAQADGTLVVHTHELLEVQAVVKIFGSRSSRIVAVDQITLSVGESQTMGIVGESGSGKTTLGRMVVGLEEPTQGRILFEGRDITRRNLREWASTIQMVFQNSYGSLNPARTVYSTLSEGIRRDPTVGRRTRRERAAELLEQVRLSPTYLDRRPHELSGGERQRVGIARALSVRPRLIVADEPVSALDVSVQAGILNLLADLREELGLSLVLISHDLAVVRYLSDDVVVMQEGRAVEQGAVALLDAPRHPYTNELLASSTLEEFLEDQDGDH